MDNEIKIKTRSKANNSFVNEIIKNKFLYMLALPGILFIIIFNYLPMFGLSMAFLEYNPIKGFTGSKFVGLRNFAFFFSGLDWPIVTLNTVYLNLLFIFGEIVFAIILAIMLNEIAHVFFKRICQSVIILPYFVSWPIVAMFSIALFSAQEGIINNLLQTFGADPINFYLSPNVWPALLVIIRIWKGAGYGTIIFIATMAGIDTELYESARIDGASRFDMIRFITVPMLKSTIVLLVLLALGKVFYGDFGMIYALIGDNSFLYPTTDVIDTFVYRSLRTLGDFGMASAVGLYQSVIGFILVIITNKLVRSYDSEATLY